MNEPLAMEQSTSSRLREKSEHLLERALDKALLALEKNAFEVKEVIKQGRDVRVKVGPVADLASILSLCKAIREQVANAPPEKPPIPPVNLSYAQWEAVSEEDKLIYLATGKLPENRRIEVVFKRPQDMNDEELMDEIKRLTHKSK